MIKARLEKLRKLMSERSIDIYIVNTSDPHQSEYVPEHYTGRTWISGFTGSAGTVVVTQDEAILWTDGRYFIQAENEIKGTSFELYKMNTPGYPNYIEWIGSKIEKNGSLGFDGKVFDEKSVESILKKIGNKDVKLVDEYDLIGEIWEDRPELSKEKAFIHRVEYTGYTTEEKINQVREIMKEKSYDNFLISGLDDIAWLYNIRGNDIECNPVVISYALIGRQEAYLFTDLSKIDAEMVDFLSHGGVILKNYEEVVDVVGDIKSGSICLDKSKINRWLYKSIDEKVRVVNTVDITTLLKGKKNEVEIKNQKNAYIKDGIAITKYLHWLDKNVGTIEIDERIGQDKLFSFRCEQDDFIENSFTTISAYKENAAMMHYSAKETGSKKLERKGLYLVDSGGQYLDGTTDITRTVPLGQISDEERKDFTLTLQSLIALSSARFLQGSTGHYLDSIARYPMWQEGLDYKCGTGHGVGYLLNVHEGPHRISSAANNVVLEKGMVTSIEPGVYKANKHGIRLENIVVVDEDIATESGQFMKFETLSYVHFDVDAIDVDMLSKKEKDWINNYNRETFEKLKHGLSEDEKAWLENKIRSI